jgi:hypothetical protein
MLKFRIVLPLLAWIGALGGCATNEREPLSESECSAAGGESLGVAGAPNNRLGDPGMDLSRTDLCPGGRKPLGVLEPAHDANGALCCQIPSTISVATCQDQGGQLLGDPGDGSTYRNGCPDRGELLGWVFACDTPGLCGEGAICCRSRQ